MHVDGGGRRRGGRGCHRFGVVRGQGGGGGGQGDATGARGEGERDDGFRDHDFGQCSGAHGGTPEGFIGERMSGGQGEEGCARRGFTAQFAGRTWPGSGCEKLRERSRRVVANQGVEAAVGISAEQSRGNKITCNGKIR